MKSPKIFISHTWRRSEDYYNIINKFKSENLEYLDYSVPEHNPFDYNEINRLQASLDEQIRQCNIFLIFVNQASANSFWVTKELDIAKKYNKPIIGVKPWNYQGGIPIIFQEIIGEIVGFNAPAIILKIKDLLR